MMPRRREPEPDPRKPRELLYQRSASASAEHSAFKLRVMVAGHRMNNFLAVILGNASGLDPDMDAIMENCNLCAETLRELLEEAERK